MSFVSVIARENFINVMSDGRVMNSEGAAIQEDYQKFNKVNDNTFIAYAGVKEPTELFIESFNRFDLFEKLKEYPIEMVAELIKTAIESSDLKNFNVLLAMGGITSTGEVGFFYYNSINSELLIKKPKGQDIEFCFLHNGLVDAINTNDVLVNALRRNGLDRSDQVMMAQKELNDCVAAIDVSVNTNTFELSIIRN